MMHRTHAFLSAGLALLLVTGAARADRLRNVEVGQPVPPFTVPTLDGGSLESAGLRGKVALLVYVSAEQQSSERAARAAGRVLRTLDDDDVAVALLTADVTRIEHFRQLRERVELDAPVGLDIARRVYGSLGLIVLPTSIVIDREGRLAHVVSSYTPDHEHVVGACVRHALGRIDDAALARELAPETLERDRPADRIARHRAAARLLRSNALLDDAETELRAALGIDADHADAMLDLASLEIERDRVDAAEALVTRVLSADPAHRRGTLLEGVVLFHRGDLDGAERTLDRALLLNPDPVWTHYYLGRVHERRGDSAGAAEHYREALDRVLPSNPM